MNLKFRVWCKQNNKFLSNMKYRCSFIKDETYNDYRTLYFDLCGNLYYHDVSGKMFMLEKNESLSQDPDDYVIQQWTGLIDENGKEIYEGDIVETYDNIRKIEWRKAYSGLQFCEVKLSGELCDFYGGISSDAVVIGNIFENPELL